MFCCWCIFVHTPLLNAFPSFLELLSLCVAKTSCVHLGGFPAFNCRSGSVLIRSHLQYLADAPALSTALGELKQCCHSLLLSEVHSIASQH